MVLRTRSGGSAHGVCIGRNHDAGDDNRDIVRHILVERPDLVELDHPAVDLDPLKAVFSEVDQFLAILALAPARDRRQRVEARPRGVKVLSSALDPRFRGGDDRLNLP
jgi:hypothetical protein